MYDTHTQTPIYVIVTPEQRYACRAMAGANATERGVGTTNQGVQT